MNQIETFFDSSSKEQRERQDAPAKIFSVSINQREQWLFGGGEGSFVEGVSKVSVPESPHPCSTCVLLQVNTLRMKNLSKDLYH